MLGLVAGGTEGWQGTLFQLVIRAVIYLSFFHVIDKKSYMNEQEAETVVQHTGGQMNHA